MTSRAPAIVVLAGTNGGGKSSIGGEVLRQAGVDFFDPDEATRRIQELDPLLSEDDANSQAWHWGKQGLERAIENRQSFAFETTLGGSTMTQLLLKAANVGLPVRIWYVGLASPELHIARVRARTLKGGHDIPEERVRRRYDDSRSNLVGLLPHLAELKVYDNSAEADPDKATPQPQLVLHVRKGEILASSPLVDVPDWAKPIVLAAYRLLRAATPPSPEAP